MANVLPPVTRIKRAALDLLFPRWCLGCNREGEFLCRSCRLTLPVISPPVCPRCGRPQPTGTICTGCSDWSGAIDGIRAPFLFEGLIRQAIHEFKYRNLRALAPSLAELLYDYLLKNPLPGDVLVPVPLHRKRWRERGYNQSELVARSLSKLVGLPVVKDSLTRPGNTAPQARSASVSERRDNVAGAFRCTDSSLKDKRVILMDDVSTSGATLNSCASVVKSAGAVEVWGLVIALEL